MQSTISTASEELPLIIPFHESFADRIFKSDIKQHFLIFGRSNDRHFVEFLKDVEPVAEKLKDELLFVWIDPDAKREHGFILNRFEIDKTQLPCVRIVHIEDREFPNGPDEMNNPDITRFEPVDDKLDSESLLKFVEAVKTGEIEGKLVKSDHVSHDEF